MTRPYDELVRHGNTPERVELVEKPYGIGNPRLPLMRELSPQATEGEKKV